MLQVIANGDVTGPGMKLPDEITSLSITYNPPPMQRIIVPPDQVRMLKGWLNTLIKNCTCTHVVCNGMFMSIDDCTLFNEDEL